VGFLESIDLQKLASHPIILLSVAPSLVLYGLNFVLEDAVSVLSLITANTLITNTYVWNIVTSCFFETDILKVISNIGSVVMIANCLKVNNAEQAGLLLLFSILACTIGTSIYCFFSLVRTGKEDLLVTPIYGFNGVMVTLLMMARQQLGKQCLYKDIPWLTYHQSPLIVVLFQLVLWAFGFHMFSRDLSFSVIALFFSWSYLRFFYKFSDTEFGDRSDEFSFVGQFPESLHIILIPFTTAFYNIVALLGIFPVLDPAPEKKQHHHLRYDESSLPVLTNSPKEDKLAERRRAKARKLMEAKMAEDSKEPEGWDDDLASAIAYGNDIEIAVAQSNFDVAKLKV
jgi:hypothetical protein